MASSAHENAHFPCAPRLVWKHIHIAHRVKFSTGDTLSSNPLDFLYAYRARPYSVISAYFRQNFCQTNPPTLGLIHAQMSETQPVIHVHTETTADVPAVR